MSAAYSFEALHAQNSLQAEFAQEAKTCQLLGDLAPGDFALKVHEHSGGDITTQVALAADCDTLDGVEAADLEESQEITDAVELHTTDPMAHHAKYTDAEAVEAVQDAAALDLTGGLKVAGELLVKKDDDYQDVMNLIGELQLVAEQSRIDVADDRVAMYVTTHHRHEVDRQPSLSRGSEPDVQCVSDDRPVE